MLVGSGCFLLAIGCAAQEMNPTTTPVAESQLLPSKELKNHHAWSWSQPDVASSSILPISSAPQLPINSDFYLPGVNLNGHGSGFQRTDYFPYPYEAAITEDSHQPMIVKDTENSIGTVNKHLAIVSFIGLLLLFAIVQNTIAAAKRRDSVNESFASREKRETITGLRGFDPMTPEEAEVLSDDAKVRCMQRTLCLENRRLRKDFGKIGRLFANFLTETVKNSVKGNPGWDSLVEDAGQAGLRGEDCDILYRDCDPFED